MTYALYVIIAVSAIAVLVSLADSSVRWWNAVGDMLRIRAASLRPQPASPFSQSDIAIAGGLHG